MPNERYTAEALLKSKLFKDVQQDFLKAILIKDSYTIAEARKAVKEALRAKGDTKENEL